MAAVLVLGVLSACGSGDGGPRPAAGADVQVMLGQALSAEDVVRLRVEVHGPGISTPVGTDLTRNGSIWLGSLRDIPVGEGRVFVAAAYDAASAIRYQGQAGPMTIQPGRVAAVMVVLQEANPPAPFSNEAPIIDSLAASASEVEPGASLNLVAVSHDNNPGDTLTYAWSATGGTFSAGNAASTTWTAPDTEGVQRLQLEVRDSKNATATVSVDLNVRGAGPAGRASVSATVNTWPEVSAMMGVPSVLAVGGTTQLAVVAADPDGDTLSYIWGSTCQGFFNGAADSRTPAFTLTAAPEDARCVFYAYVTDGRGGSQSGSLTLQVGPGPHVSLGQVPVVDSVSQSANEAQPGQVVTFVLGAHDPDGTALSFSWSASQGTVSATRSSGNSASADWLPPTCFGGPAEVTATVTDATGASTDATFTINPAPGTACDARTVTGRKFALHVQSDGSVISRPQDLRDTFFVAWVPTEDGSYSPRYGTGLADGTFIIPDVERTPYLLEDSGIYFWTDSRTPDLSYAVAGRPDVEPELDSTVFSLDLAGLNPWQADDDLQLSAFGAGISYFSARNCTASLAPEAGATVLTASTLYGESFGPCSGYRGGRIDLSRGDEVHIAQMVARAPVGGLDTLLEARQGVHLFSGSPGGGVVSGPDGVFMTGTLAPLATTSRTVRIPASEFESVVLSAHPRAVLRPQTLSVGALPGFMQFGTYTDWMDLAIADNFTPGKPLLAPSLEVAGLFPETWSLFAANISRGAVSYSVPLPGGGNSTPSAHGFNVYSHEPFADGPELLLAPRLSAPRAVSLNGQPATEDGLQGVGTAPLVSWEAPLHGVPTSYTVHLFQLSVTSTQATRRVLQRVFTTNETQLRLLPDSLVPGRHYYLYVRANLLAGGDVSRPNLDAPWSATSAAFTGRFQP